MSGGDLVDDPTHSSPNTRSFPVGGLVGVFVAVVVLALAFVACGVTRRRQQRRKAQMAFNHEQFYAEHHQTRPPARPQNSILNKPLPGQGGASNISNQAGLGNTTSIYANYSSGGGPPVFNKDVEMGPPPPAYEPRGKGSR